MTIITGFWVISPPFSEPCNTKHEIRDCFWETRALHAGGLWHRKQYILHGCSIVHCVCAFLFIALGPGRTPLQALNVPWWPALCVGFKCFNQISAHFYWCSSLVRLGQGLVTKRKKMTVCSGQAVGQWWKEEHSTQRGDISITDSRDYQRQCKTADGNTSMQYTYYCTRQGERHCGFSPRWFTTWAVASVPMVKSYLWKPYNSARSIHGNKFIRLFI